MAEEYEVELIDYLRVIWKWKWLIIAVLVVSVAVSAGVSFTQPDRYEGKVLYRVEEMGAELGIPAPNAQERTALLEGIEPGEGLTLEAQVKDNGITITLSGAVSTGKMKEALSRLTPLVREKVIEDLRGRMDQALRFAGRRKEQLSREKALLYSQMEASTSPELTAALADRVGALALQLVQVDVQMESLRKTDPAELLTLETLKAPAVSLIGPHRTLNIAVAAVLGGFVGVLLSFFLNYLLSYRQREG